jgi:hypothetical protein
MDRLNPEEASPLRLVLEAFLERLLGVSSRKNRSIASGSPISTSA